MTDFQGPYLDESTGVDLAMILGEMGAVVLARETVDTVVELVTALAKATIPHTSWAGVSLIDEHGQRSVAATEAIVERADTLQYELGAGPCLTAWREQVHVKIDDVTLETRWPQWCAAAAALGIRSVLTIPLTAEGIAVGAIKVYTPQVRAYDDRAEDLLTLFAQQAAVLLANAQTLTDARRLADDLRDALVVRDIVGQAKGVLIAQGAVDEAAAFAVLTAMSQRLQTTMHTVARQLVDATRRRSRDGVSE